MKSSFSHDVCVIGGGGHVGLPFALICAESGLDTVIYDTDPAKIETIRRGQMPFREAGADELLTRMLGAGRLDASGDTAVVRGSRLLVVVIGTPIDQHLNPSFSAIDRVLSAIRGELVDGHTIVLRSTVFPGTTRRIQAWIDRLGLGIGVACCPERVAQGHSLREIRELPQIVSACDATTLGVVKELFERFATELIELEPLEAELCKLMTNSWRYIQFATVNQFYMLATSSGVDFARVLHGCRHHYPRMSGMPGPGLAAGPCLVKDTMQLAAYSHNQFVLGHAAMMVNEGLPQHLIELARREVDLAQATAGILGTAFKAESDDSRDSLAYKLRKLLGLEAKRVLATDPYVPDPSLVGLEQVLAESDVLFVCTPHDTYRRIECRPGTVVVDVWNWLPRARAGSAGSAAP